MAKYIKSDASEHVVLYANNTKTIYDKIEWLKRVIKERMANGQPANVEYLANCSNMRAIVRDAAKLARQDEWCRPTSDDLGAARERLAQDIFDEAELELKQNL